MAVIYTGRVACKTAETICGKVFFSENDLAQLPHEQNAIFVARDTSVSDMSKIKKASAVLTEHGGILCHAAIVCRELSIPCIVAIQGIYEAVNVGDEIIIDFNQGTVNVIAENS